MAFPAVVEAIETSTNTAGTSHVVTLPTATAGHLLLIILDKGSTSATIDAHASLTELLDEASANGLYIAYRWMDGTEPASYTLTSSASTRTARIAYRISGAVNPAAQAPQIGTTGTGTSATPDPPASAAPGSAKDYLFIAFAGMAGEEADDDAWGNTPPADYTPSPPRQKSCGTNGTNLGGLILAAERQLNTGSAADPGTFGVDASAAWRSQTIMVHPVVDTTVTPGTKSLTTTPYAPTVTASNNVAVVPGTLALADAQYTPVVTASDRKTATPGVATLTTTPLAPTVGVGVRAAPGVVAVAATRLTPVVTATANQTATAGVATVTTTPLAPVVSISDHKLFVPGVVALTATPLTPTVTASAGSDVEVTPGAAVLMFAWHVPHVGPPGRPGSERPYGIKTRAMARPRAIRAMRVAK